MQINISYLQAVEYCVLAIYYISIGYFWVRDRVKGRPS